MEFVIKRDGLTVIFQKEKIVKAIEKANASVHKKYRCTKKDAERIATAIDKMATCMTVEKIQDQVQSQLNQLGYEELAFSYVSYRKMREIDRKATVEDLKMLNIIRNSDATLRDENSNKNTRIVSTQRDYLAGETSRNLSRKYIIPEKLVQAHDNGVLHFHDMDYQAQDMFNCCLINIQDMLDNGTVMNRKMIETPKSFQVACTVMTQIIAAVASHQYGGQSVDIRHLGKYLRKTYDKAYRHYQDICPEKAKELAEDKMKQELRSGVQTIQYQINTLMTTNGQAPFVTLFLNIIEGDEYEKEVAMIVEEILRQRLEGIKNEKGVYVTPAFPKLIYVLDEHNCLKGGKYDDITRLAVRCSAKRMYPRRSTENWGTKTF